MRRGGRLWNGPSGWRRRNPKRWLTAAGFRQISPTSGDEQTSRFCRNFASSWAWTASGGQPREEHRYLRIRWHSLWDWAFRSQKYGECLSSAPWPRRAIPTTSGSVPWAPCYQGWNAELRTTV